MQDYNKLKNKYSRILEKAFNKNKSILLESFIEYYGEEYRQLIETRFSEITFVLFFDKSVLCYALATYPDSFNEDKYVFNYNELYFSYAMVHSNNNSKNIPDNILWLSNPSKNDDKLFHEYLQIVSKFDGSVTFCFGHGDKVDRLVGIRMMTADEQCIIHEINHAIVANDIALLKYKKGKASVIVKSGLCILNSNLLDNDNIMTEELLNERSSVDIYKIFKDKGGDLSLIVCDFPIGKPYRDNLYLVDDFYNLFKDTIKKARITDNKNELVGRIGKRDYQLYTELVNNIYYNGHTYSEKEQDLVIAQLKCLLKIMKTNFKKAYKPTKEEIREMLNKLYRSGSDIRIINNLDDYDEEIKTSQK